MLIVHGVCIALFVILGFVFRAGKGSFLIAGYNTASKAEKEKTDEKKLCWYMSGLMFLLAACWLVLAAGTLIGRMWLFWLGFALFLVVCIGGVIYMNTGDRLKK